MEDMAYTTRRAFTAFVVVRHDLSLEVRRVTGHPPFSVDQSAGPVEVASQAWEAMTPACVVDFRLSGMGDDWVSRSL